MREAFATGFDRVAFCREVNFGFCLPTHSWYAPGTPGYVDSDVHAFDPQAAREALAASSYGSPRALPEIVWHYDPDPGAESLGQSGHGGFVAAFGSGEHGHRHRPRQRATRSDWRAASRDQALCLVDPAGPADRRLAALLAGGLKVNSLP